MKHTTTSEGIGDDNKLHNDSMDSNRDRILHSGDFQEMTTQELAKQIGQTATLAGRRNEFKTAVRILDAKQVYGCLRYQVTPLEGTGSVWVNAERVTFSNESEVI
jgi:hypothetical protein